MIKLYVVRHGETDGNVQQWYQGSTDVPLNARGIEQAQCLSRFLKDVPFSGIYSSTLQRARRTAEIVAEPHGLPVYSYDELGGNRRRAPRPARIFLRRAEGN